MGSVCAGVPLRGLDPAFVMLAGFLTGRLLMCAFLVSAIHVSVPRLVYR
jgi:hypothetical protein